MQVCIHRGSKEIGGSCVEVVADSGERIILDLGLPLDAESNDKKYLLNDAIYIYSQWEGYWGKEENKYLREWIEKNNIPKISIHTSGHASPADLKRFALALAPVRIVPIHTFMPEKYQELYTNAEYHEDGDFWKV
ncbi:MAG: hypothetical protein WCJ95_13950 [Mariniphaga sp.]